MRLNYDSDSDKDALHILPLGILPLRTPGLRQARMIKNSQLDGVVELFRGTSTGSGQIATSDLPKVFQMGDNEQHDIKLLNAVSRLPSFDVYSLRIELRRLGIDVENTQNLKLSKQAQTLSKPYMREYTRPLIEFLSQGSGVTVNNDSDITALLQDSGNSCTRDNFVRLADRLGMDLRAIPGFLEDYSDVFLSLAYYDLCTRRMQQQSRRALQTIDKLKLIPLFAQQPRVVQSMHKVERCLDFMSNDISQVINDFKSRTALMWEDITAESFSQMRELVLYYQTRLGSSLCAATAKICAWDERFPPDTVGSPGAHAMFLQNDMAPGLELLKKLPRLGADSQRPPTA
jgi:hypothetical protein